MTNLKLALDWTPNTNHIGFFIANELGFYEKNGIHLEIIDPRVDNYEKTPGKKLAEKEVDFAIAPFETVISLNTKKNKVEALAIYAILQEDLSSIACLTSSRIKSPKQLDGKIYASYKARYEDEIVKSMIRNNQGIGNIKIEYPTKLGIWNTLLSGEANATWIFDNWEGIEAEGKNISLTHFKMKDYHIPYSYSPVVVCRKEAIASNVNAYQKFVEQSKRGFLYAKENLTHAEEILKKHLTEYDQVNINLSKSISYTVPFFGDEHSAGKMDKERVDLFLKWIVENNLESDIILNQPLYTNDLFQ
ncbi:MAG: ABC transporter substrate-binding protein [Bacteroidia bacterium]|nr:ABC transporter substrate-binding protein [Bacteroidia bacterium]